MVEPIVQKDPWSMLKGTVIFEAKADSLGNIVINAPNLNPQMAVAIILNLLNQVLFASFEPKSQLIQKVTHI